MPELPDLEIILRKIKPKVEKCKILKATVFEPIILRMMIPGTFSEVLVNQCIEKIWRHGPFLIFEAGVVQLVVHCMLTGTFQLADEGMKQIPYLAFSINLDNSLKLNFGDRRRMAKVYIVRPQDYGNISMFSVQGVDILSEAFTEEVFLSLIQGRRNQVRVFLLDQAVLSAIGNAYADEILFHAGIYPKTLCNALTEEDKKNLYQSILKVIEWGTEEVEKAGKPIEYKVRDHVRVRNRNGEKCYVCGGTVRRTQVHGYDSFFCPKCQPPKGKQFIPWGQ